MKILRPAFGWVNVTMIQFNLSAAFWAKPMSNTRKIVIVAVAISILIGGLAMGPAGWKWLNDFLKEYNAVITALATVVIAAYTVVLAQATTNQAAVTREALKATQTAADAAMLQARAAIGIELPVLRLPAPDQLLQLAGPLPADGAYAADGNDFVPTRYSAVGDFGFRNVGRTPAFPLRLEFGWKVCTVLPDIPEYTTSAPLIHSAVIAPNAAEVWDPHFDVGIEVTAEDVAELAADTKWLWLYGRLTYTTFLDEENEYRFCWRRRKHEEGPLHFFKSDGNPPTAYLGRSIPAVVG